MHALRGVFVGSPPPGPEVVLTNFFAEPTVLLVPIASRDVVMFYIVPNIVYQLLVNVC